MPIELQFGRLFLNGKSLKSIVAWVTATLILLYGS